MQVEEWNAKLRKTCGHYYGIPGKSQSHVDGDIRCFQFHGLDVASLACDLDHIERTREGILRDDGEYIFLLLQLAGSARIEQDGALEILEPGGCYLLDSTKASRLTYSGERTQLLSVHMPRASFLLEADGSLRIGTALGARDPMSADLHGFFTGGTRALRQGKTTYCDPRYLFDVARMAFALDDKTRDATRLRSAANRVELAVRIMERNLDRADLSLQWLAREVNLSPRQLQRDFLGFGTSFVRLLRRKRLALATEMLQTATRTRRPQSIADVAFSVGFNDISNFNRAFKARYGRSPTDYAGALSAGTA